jgi:hypothetical protein
MRIVAFDSKSLRRGNFRALIGVAITIHDSSVFEEKFVAILKAYFQSMDYPMTRDFYKSSDLLKMFHALDPEVIETLALQICTHIDYIDFYYTYFAHSNSDSRPVTIYYKHSGEKISHDRFLDKIENYYPVLCCYGLSSGLQVDPTDKYLLDGCSGIEPSIATRTILKNPRVLFLHNGDRVNASICAADIILKFIDRFTAQNDAYLNRHLIEKLPSCFHGKISCTNIGTQWFYQIVPEERISLDITKKLARPVHFIVRNKNSLIFKSESDFKKSPVFDYVVQEARNEFASTKLFDVEDVSMIQTDDKIYYYDAVTEDYCKELKEHGIQAKFIDYRKIDK